MLLICKYKLGRDLLFRGRYENIIVDVCTEEKLNQEIILNTKYNESYMYYNN